MAELSDREIGTRLGQLLVAIVDLLADIDGISRAQVLERLFTDWWETRITEP